MRRTWPFWNPLSENLLTWSSCRHGIGIIKVFSRSQTWSKGWNRHLLGNGKICDNSALLVYDINKLFSSCLAGYTIHQRYQVLSWPPAPITYHAFSLSIKINLLNVHIGLPKVLPDVLQKLVLEKTFRRLGSLFSRMPICKMSMSPSSYHGNPIEIPWSKGMEDLAKLTHRWALDPPWLAHQ